MFSERFRRYRGVSDMLNHRRQRGLSLVELMIGLLVGLIVVAGASAMYMTNVRGQTNALRAAKLNQDLRATMSVMVSDIRRAGYWQGSITGAGAAAPLPHPYSHSALQAYLSVLVNGTCIMYAYDSDADGANLPEGGEVFGFRLNGDVVQMLDPTDAATIALNTTTNCGAGGWAAMTSNDTVVIDSLTFSTTGSQCFDATTDLSWQVTAADSTNEPCSAPQSEITMNTGAYIAPVTNDVALEMRQVTITLTGHHRSDAALISTITETVHVPNNRMFLIP